MQELDNSNNNNNNHIFIFKGNMTASLGCLLKIHRKRIVWNSILSSIHPNKQAFYSASFFFLFMKLKNNELEGIEYRNPLVCHYIVGFVGHSLAVVTLIKCLASFNCSRFQSEVLGI